MAQKSDSKINSDLSDESKSFQERVDDIRSLVEENLRYTKSLHSHHEEEADDDHEELKMLLRENLKISKELRAMMRKMNRWVAMQRVWTVVKILLIVIPLVLGLIYLPPLIKNAVEPYQGLLEAGSQQNSLQENLLNQFNQLIDGNQETTTPQEGQ